MPETDAAPLSRPFDALRQDLKVALRLLVKDRGYAATALATLAVAIGATVAVASVYHSVVLRPLPFPEPDRLVTLYNLYPGAGVSERGQNSVPHYFERRQEVEAFEEVALYDEVDRTLDAGDAAERIGGGLATPSLFRVLRVEAAVGRLFTEQEAEPGNDRTVVLSQGLARRLFGAAEDAPGETVRLDGESYRVVGVLPAGFRLEGVEEAEIWTPAAFDAEDRSEDRRHSNNWNMLARLRPGATVERAQAQVDALNARERERFPEMAELIDASGFHTPVVPFHEELVRNVRPTLGLLLVGALFVLLIACVNLANLTLARSTARLRELATRCALGAGRRRVAAQLVVESLVLSVAGGALGLLAGLGGLRLLAALGVERIPRGAEISLDWPVALLALAAATVIGVGLGTIPVAQLFRGDLHTYFRQDSRTGSAGRRAVAARDLLVAVQVAVAAILLIGAGLLLASFLRLLAVDPGFEPEGVLTATVSLPAARYDEEPARRAFAQRVLAEARALPGVDEAALASSIPFGGRFSANAVSIEGYVRRPGESLLAPFMTAATPGYFEALGIPLLDGRTFTSEDREDSLPVVIVDRWLAERFWPGESAVGQRIAQGVPELDDEGRIEWRTIVGVVGEVRMAELGEGGQTGAYYFPYAQAAAYSLVLTLIARVAGDGGEGGDPEALAEPLRRSVRAIDPALPVFDLATMEERLGRSLVERRAAMVLAVVFGAVALFLAAVGLYGVLAYSVAQRTRELGIRVVLGSTTRGILGLVLGRSARLTGIGLAAGLAGAFLLTRSMAALLYGVEATDPGVYAGVALVLAAVALAASLVPARRATRVDPAVVLAAE
ncbi:MAG TPA: ABC transporter permease [Thermoanaerobaculia bacterium]|nr:ABC transporter permease [Thermoanaerobaculia bacterium]